MSWGPREGWQQSHSHLDVSRPQWSAWTKLPSSRTHVALLSLTCMRVIGLRAPFNLDLITEPNAPSHANFSPLSCSTQDKCPLPMSSTSKQTISPTIVPVQTQDIKVKEGKVPCPARTAFTRTLTPLRSHTFQQIRDLFWAGY